MGGEFCVRMIILTFLGVCSSSYTRYIVTENLENCENACRLDLDTKCCDYDRVRKRCTFKMSTGLGLKRDHDHFSMCKNKDDEWDGEIRGEFMIKEGDISQINSKRYVRTKDSKDCISICQYDQDCKFWTWYKNSRPNIEEFGFACHLKSLINEGTLNDDFIEMNNSVFCGYYILWVKYKLY